MAPDGGQLAVRPRPGRFAGLTLDGPLASRDATVLLSVATFLITARAPMGFVLLALGPAAVAVVQGLRRNTGLPLRRLWVLLGSMLGCALLSVVLLHPSELARTGSSLTAAIVVCCVAAGALLTGRPRQGANRLLDGIYAGLLFHWAVSMLEGLTGFKLLPIMYPGANTIVWVNSHRFYVTSLFPNYNDYSVAMTLLVMLVVVRMLFNARVHPLVGLGRVLVVLTAAFEITYMGSRGSLIALVVMVLLAVVINIRSLHPRFFGLRSVVFALLLVGSIAIGLATSPIFGDNSTMQRGLIAGRIGEMMLASPLEGLLGWGSYPSYQAAAKAAFGGVLMDPHNSLLETIVWFGLPSLLAYLACWASLARRGFWRREMDSDWRSVGALVAALCYPLLGVVPSSTLRYYLVWVFLVVAMGRLAVARRERQQGVRGSAAGQLHQVVHQG